MKTYYANDTGYVDIKDVRAECKAYCKGIRSNTGLLETKGITQFVYGRIVDGELVVTDKLSKKTGSTFIVRDVLSDVLEATPCDTLPIAPPLITDSDLVFFKDDDGVEYTVPMRGERTKEGIFFQVKSVMNVFQMENLQSNVQLVHTGYAIAEHYIWFDVSESYNVCNQQVKEMYLTYHGLMRVINSSRSGVAHKFKSWIDEIVFSSLWGTQTQKVDTFSKVLNVDADHLKAVMSKSPVAISCLYLIDVGQHGGKKVFKYGFTDNVRRRFKQHMKHYGDHIKLDTFILIPVLDLSKAEAEFKNSVSRYKYDKDGESELIALCEDAYINAKNIFKTISDKYCGNMKSQVSQYEQEIMSLTHAHQLDVLRLENTIQIKDMVIQSKDKDIEILMLRLKLAQVHN